MLFVGNDWAEEHHDVELVDDVGRRLIRRRVPEGIEGMATLHAVIADHLPEDGEASDVVVGIETDRGPWVAALVAAGYQVYAINPMQVARYRERHGTSGAKSDRGDAHVLAEIVRLDRAHHQPVAADSELAGAIKVLARVHQNLIWTRQRQVNQLRSMLREYYPAALHAVDDLVGRDALAVLAAAPTPAAGRALTVDKITELLHQAGRRRYLATTAAKIHQALQTEHLQALPQVVEACGASTRALVSILTEMSRQIDAVEQQVVAHFGRHPDGKIYLSQPGLERSSPPGSSPNSETPPTGTPTPKHAATTLAPPPSPAPPARRLWSWPATHAINASPTHSFSKHSPRSQPHPAPTPSTTISGPATSATTTPSADCLTASSESCTAAYGTAPPTTKPPPGPPPTKINTKPLDNLRPWDV